MNEIQTREISIDKTKFFKDLDDGKVVEGSGQTICDDMKILIGNGQKYKMQDFSTNYGNGRNYHCMAYKVRQN